MLRGLQVVSRSAEETRILGAALAPTLLPGDVVSLAGDLGAGKTAFVQGVVTALGVSGPVTSPSFTLLHEYDARYRVLHLDIYRLGSFQEVLDLGFEDLITPEAILLIEWGDAVEPLLPRQHLRIDLRRSDTPDADDERVVTFRPRGEDWSRKVDGMKTVAEALLDAASDEENVTPRFTELSREALRARPQEGGN
jgi:tRNA threonylcarbamoyladenosine biosynthesis protein TsaE